MRIFRSLEEVPADFGPTILSVGNFDGIHCGHLSVLKEVTERARQNNSKAMAVTFEPHPFRILRPDVTPRLITPLAKKEALLAQTGLDALLEIPFTRDFSMTTPEEFARDILAGKLRAKEVHEGDNFHFGHNAQGTTASLKDLGKQFGFDVRVYPVMMVRGIPGFQQPDTQAPAGGQSEHGAAAAGTRVQHYRRSGTRTRLWPQIHCPNDQPEPL